MVILPNDSHMFLQYASCLKEYKTEERSNDVGV
jgi:hypothetical protein